MNDVASFVLIIGAFAVFGVVVELWSMAYARRVMRRLEDQENDYV